MSSTVAERMKSHFSMYKTRVIEVPEWPDEDGKPTLVYAKPMTLAEKQKMQGYSEHMGMMEVLAATLIMKAEDGQGKKMFTLEDKHTMMHRADGDVLARVVREITKAYTIEETEKN